MVTVHGDGARLTLINLQVITQGLIFLLVTVSIPRYKCMQPEALDDQLPVFRCFCQDVHIAVGRYR